MKVDEVVEQAAATAAVRISHLAAVAAERERLKRERLDEENRLAAERGEYC